MAYVRFVKGPPLAILPTELKKDAMKQLILLLTLLAIPLLGQANYLFMETIQCRYQLRNDGYSQPMPFTLEVKVATENNQRYVQASLSSVSRFFSALNIQVRSIRGFETQANGMLRMQSSDMTVNSKAEILNRTIKLEVRDLDGQDWRSISCLHNNLATIVQASMQDFRSPL